MDAFQPFSPAPQGTVKIDATSASARVALSPAFSDTIEVSNEGTDTVFVCLGGSGVTAATTDYPVLAGQSKVIPRASAAQTYGAAICASGKTATVYFCCGKGA